MTISRTRQVLLSLALALLLLLGTSGRRSDVLAPSRWLQPAPAMAYVAEMPAIAPADSWASARHALKSSAPAAAVDDLRRALVENPDLAPWIRAQLATALLASGDSAGALRELDLVAEHTPYAVANASLRRASELRLAAGDAIGARNGFERLAARSRGDEARKALVGVADARAARGEDVSDLLWEVIVAEGSPQVSVLAADRIQARGPISALTASRLAPVYYEAGHFPRAAALYEQALAGGVYATGRPAALLQLGRSYERADEFRTAIGVYRRILQEHPGVSTGTVKYRIGLCHQRVGEDAEGERWFREVLEADPRSSFADDILYRMATRRDRRDERAEARALYERLLTRHPRSSWADEAAWKIGFGLFEDGRMGEALAAFTAALRRFPNSDFAPAMGYWKARILEQSGDRDGSRAAFVEVVRSAREPYYRVRSAAALRRLGYVVTVADFEAAERLSREGRIAEGLRELRVVRDLGDGELSARAAARIRDLAYRLGAWGDLARFDSSTVDVAALLQDLPGADRAAVEVIRRLAERGAWEEAAAELLAFRIDAGARPERRLAIARVLAEGGAYRSAMREVEGLVRGVGSPIDAAALPPLVARLLYPGYYGPIVRQEAAREGVDPRLVLAVIREESRFQADVASWAGAQGLMQIMPATGAGVARALGVQPFTFHMLHDPRTNVAFGTHYLAGLLGEYGGKPHLALAGYNAGPGNANRWIRQNPGVPEDVWIERISFRETRNYVKRVLGTYWTYRQLEGEPLGVL